MLEKHSNSPRADACFSAKVPQRNFQYSLLTVIYIILFKYVTLIDFNV